MFVLLRGVWLHYGYLCS